MEVVDNKVNGFIFKLILLLILITSAVQFLAVLYWPYDYYVFLRYISFLALSIVATKFFINKWLKVAFISAMLSILFNPIFPIYLTRDIWFYINISTGAYLLYVAWLVSKKVHRLI